MTTFCFFTHCQTSIFFAKFEVWELLFFWKNWQGRHYKIAKLLAPIFGQMLDSTHCQLKHLTKWRDPFLRGCWQWFIALPPRAAAEQRVARKSPQRRKGRRISGVIGTRRRKGSQEGWSTAKFLFLPLMCNIFQWKYNSLSGMLIVPRLSKTQLFVFEHSGDTEDFGHYGYFRFWMKQKGAGFWTLGKLMNFWMTQNCLDVRDASQFWTYGSPPSKS